MKYKNRNMKFLLKFGTLSLAGLFTVLMITSCKEKDPKKDDPKEDAKDYSTLCNKAHDEWLTCMDKIDVSKSDKTSTDELDLSGVDILLTPGNIEKINKASAECQQFYDKKMIEAFKLLTKEQLKQKQTVLTEMKGLAMTIDISASSECNAKEGNAKIICTRKAFIKKTKEKLCSNG